MRKIAICIGSSCHLKGSKRVHEEIVNIIDEYGLNDQIELEATFCLGKCVDGVSVTLDGEVFSLTPDTVREFFKKEILK